MKSKLKFVIPLALLIVLGGAYKVVLAKPPTKPKLEGALYVLPKEFVLNLADAHFAKVNVALVLPEGAVPKSAEGATPPDGYGVLPQEAAVRAVVTDRITDASEQDLTNRKRRTKLRAEILKEILADTDVKAKEVLFTDVAVQ